MQRDCFPNSLHLIFSDVVGIEELSGGIGAIDLEAFVRARELPDKAEIVKCRGHVKKFRIANTRAGFTTIVSLKFGPDGLLYVLELSDTPNGFPNPGDGKVLRLNADGTIQTVVTGLQLPGGMTFGPDKALYISNAGDLGPGKGQIVRIAIPK